MMSKMNTWYSTTPITPTTSKQYVSTIDSKYEIEDNESTQKQDLCISKEFDLKNGYPICMWLLDKFSRDRIEYYMDNENCKYEYTLLKWWNSNNFCKWISSKNFKTSPILKSALQTISRRIFFPLNVALNPRLTRTIFDSLNDFAKITLQIYDFLHEIIKLMAKNEKYPFAPVQFGII